MQRIPVDATRLGQVLALDVVPKPQHGSTEQAKNAQGVPVWHVRVLIQPPARPDGTAERPEIEAVSVAAHDAPVVTPMSPAAFTDLSAYAWRMDNGNSGVSLSASAVQTAHASKRGE